MTSEIEKVPGNISPFERIRRTNETRPAAAMPS